MYFLIGKPKGIADLKAFKKPFTSSERPKIPIAVIDDEEFSYLDTLRDHQYNIKVFKDIEDVRNVEGFAIVMCDIKGVGKHFGSKYEGAHLISEIRKLYPTKVIIAYTAHQFDASYNRYFQMSDYLVKKDIDCDAWIEKLDIAIEKAMDPVSQWIRLRDYLIKKDVTLWQLMKLEHELVSYLTEQLNDFPTKSTSALLPDEVRTVIVNFTTSFLSRLLTGK